MTKSIRNSIFLLILALGLVNWGGTGHQIISSKASLSFPSTMTGFSIWSDSLKLHASDADTRKSADATESPKHFIDIDNYPEFILSGSIAQLYDSVVASHGFSFVIDQGILPWATLTTFDSLRALYASDACELASRLHAVRGPWSGERLFNHPVVWPDELGEISA